MPWTTRVLPAFVVLILAAQAATAQTLGPFTWQTQPYCNVLTVTVVPQGSHYQVVGHDNLCGAGVAPVTGTAVPVGGDVRFGLTIATPSGRAAHLTATISLGSLSGTWTDNDGRSGTFQFAGSGGGSARPAPALVGVPRVTRLLYTQSATSAGGTISPPVSLRTLGTFTSAGGALRLTWISHVTAASPGGGVCNFQLRIDGAPSGAVATGSLVGDEAVVINGATRNDAPVSLTTWFTNVPAGNHTVSLWIRSVDSTCTDNAGNYSRTVLVEEFGAP